MSWLANAALTVLVMAVLIGFAYGCSALAHRFMNKTSASMSKKHGGLQVHPYMEMIPGRVGQQGGRESEIMIAPDADLSRTEAEDPKRA